jgi:hypothetical protein
MRARNSSLVASHDRTSSASASHNLHFQENTMKSLQRLFTVVVLTFTFALPAFAGDMDCPIVPPPPPRMVQSEIQVQPTGEAVSGETLAIDPMTEIGLSVLQTVLALF